MRYFIYFSYDGSDYHGWQNQPNGVSVQETLEKALSLILREKIDIVAAGRTDAGVHAAYMTAHFNFHEAIDTIFCVNRLNAMLPRDIAIFSIEQVADDMHARFSAKERTYQYHVVTKKSPFLRNYAILVNEGIDFDKMNEAAQILLCKEDFTSFSKLHTDVKTNICRVTYARWNKGNFDGEYVFTITANRFLRNMVRAIVGTLLEVGRGKLSIADFERIIDEKDRCKAGSSAAGKGLFLTNVTY